MHQEVDCDAMLAAGSESETNDNDVVDSSSSNVFQYVTSDSHADPDTTQLIATGAADALSLASDYKVFVNGTAGECVRVESRAYTQKT